MARPRRGRRVGPADREEERERILRAAARVFAREGLAKTSMRAIAEEAACTTGAIYPLFEGKEEIYACLLDRSLVELRAAVATAAAIEANPMEALAGAARAWNAYYLAHPFEAELGLYLHGTRETRGLGRTRDRELNARLVETLDVFTAGFVRLAPKSMPHAKIEDWARRERDVLFAQLIGILVLARSGRTRSIGTDVDELLETSLRALRERLGR